MSKAVISALTDRRLAPARDLIQSLSSWGSLTGVGVCCLSAMLSSIKCLAIIRVYLTLRVKKTLCVVSRRLLCCCVMATQPIPYPLRMPEELRAQLEARAAARKRSLNAEILDVLQSSVDSNQSSEIDLEKLAEAVATRVAAKLKDSKS